LPDASTFPWSRAGTVGRQPRAVLLHQDQTNQSPQGLPGARLGGRTATASAARSRWRRAGRPWADPGAGRPRPGARRPTPPWHGPPWVRLAKLPTSQLKSLASLLSWGMAILTLWRPGHRRAAQGGRRPAGLDPGRRPGGRAGATLVAGSILRTSSGQHAEVLVSRLVGGRPRSMRNWWTQPTATTVNQRLLFGVLVGPPRSNVGSQHQLGSLVGRVLGA
jgi:hypothetical protein